MHRIWLIHQNGKLTQQMLIAYPQFNRSCWVWRILWQMLLVPPYPLTLPLQCTLVFVSSHFPKPAPASLATQEQPPINAQWEGRYLWPVCWTSAPRVSPRGGELRSPTGWSGLVMHLFLVPFSSLPSSVSFTSQERVPKSLSWVSCASRTPRDQDSVLAFQDLEGERGAHSDSHTGDKFSNVWAEGLWGVLRSTLVSKESCPCGFPKSGTHMVGIPLPMFSTGTVVSNLHLVLSLFLASVSSPINWKTLHCLRVKR